MKRKLSFIYLIQTAIVVLVIFIPSVVHAQPGFGDDVDDVPIDGGLLLLIAAGIGYGVKKLRKPIHKLNKQKVF